MDSDNFQSCFSIQDAVVLRGTAIVAEGGGQRGIYTAGVLDAFLSAGFNPFELIVASLIWTRIFPGLSMILNFVFRAGNSMGWQDDVSWFLWQRLWPA